MKYYMPVTLEDLRGLTDDQVIERINAKIAPGIEPNSFTGDGFSLPDFVSAQFYLAELERRERRRAEEERDEIDRKRWRIDFWAEAMIIILILIEIGLSVWDHNQYQKNAKEELRAFTDMQSVLSALRDSSRETAETMKAERQTMEAMKQSLERQVELFYDVQLNMVFEPSGKKLVLINTGRSSVAIYEVFIGGALSEHKTFEKPQLLAPSSTQEFDLGKLFDALDKELPKGEQRTYTYSFFLKNEKQEKFTLTADLLAAWHGDTLSFFTQPNTVIPGWKK
jgi:hypothetical protein